MWLVILYVNFIKFNQTVVALSFAYVISIKCSVRHVFQHFDFINYHFSYLDACCLFLFNLFVVHPILFKPNYFFQIQLNRNVDSFLVPKLITIPNSQWVWVPRKVICHIAWFIFLALCYWFMHSACLFLLYPTSFAVWSTFTESILGLPSVLSSSVPEFFFAIWSFCCPHYSSQIRKRIICHESINYVMWKIMFYSKNK